VSHPSLGLPPPDLTAGFPAAAARLDANRSRLAARALEIAVENDPTFRDRYDELGLRRLLHDAEVLLQEIARCVASGDPTPMRSFADWVAPVYRRRSVPMDDLVQLAEGIRAAAATVLSGPELDSLHAAIDAAIEGFRWHRRIAGDARKRNRLLQAIYKGA
jgi:phycobilisome protein